MSYELLSQSRPIARKPHTCDWCGDDILKGERYEVHTGFYNGEFQTSRFHAECVDPCMEHCRENEEFTPRAFKRGTTEER